VIPRRKKIKHHESTEAEDGGHICPTTLDTLDFVREMCLRNPQILHYFSSLHPSYVARTILKVKEETGEDQQEEEYLPHEYATPQAKPKSQIDWTTSRLKKLVDCVKNTRPFSKTNIQIYIRIHSIRSIDCLEFPP
jgi:hypothetical protein